MRERFCLICESRNRAYYCSSRGRVLSVSKTDRTRGRYLKELPGRRHMVYVAGRRLSIPMAMAISFFRATMEAYSPRGIRVTYRDGDEGNLAIENLLLWFDDVGAGRGTEERCSRLKTTSRSPHG